MNSDASIYVYAVWKGGKFDLQVSNRLKYHLQTITTDLSCESHQTASDLFRRSPVRESVMLVVTCKLQERSCGSFSVLNCICAFRPVCHWILAYKGSNLFFLIILWVPINSFWFGVILENIYGETCTVKSLTVSI